MNAHDAPRRSFWRRRRSFWRRRRATIALAVAGGLGAFAIAGLDLLGGSDGGPAIAAFYDQPAALPSEAPGTIVRSELLTEAPPGSKAYRFLYRSRSHTGRPVALSALLFVPLQPAPPSGRDIVALTHGTVGVARHCAVSSGRSFFAHVDGLTRFLRADHAVVVPDYEGLGTSGPHPYLVGGATAHATLDAVRATIRFPPANASMRFVAWGVGQGGHAALFTGQEAGDYAPELELAGVAAGAPMTDLRRLLAVNRDTAYGRLVAA
ncbi:MAG: lipase family protein, partial [Solirubrobacteraceae bacterium]